MLRIESHGDGVFALHDRDGRLVASLRGASLRTGAFAREADAVRAALHGDHVISTYVRDTLARSPAGENARVLEALATRGGGGARPAGGPNVGRAEERPDGVRLVSDGAYEWIVLDRRPVARIIRPGASSAAGATAAPVHVRAAADDASAPAATFALEFVVPDVVPTAMRLTLARRLHRALSPSEGRGARGRVTHARASGRSAAAGGPHATHATDPAARRSEAMESIAVYRRGDAEPPPAA